AQSNHPHPGLRPRPGRGARLLRRQARLRGEHRRRPRLHALADGPLPRTARGAPAGEAGTAGPRRGHRRADPRAGHQGRARDGGDHRRRRRPPDLRGPRRQGRRVHRGADRALLRHGLRAARPVRQPAATRDAEGGRLRAAGRFGGVGRGLVL
ncbi:MAG: Lactoylglutathione lyase and related lyases, partial [uncultured Solirubrobacteraceae bacterium]